MERTKQEINKYRGTKVERACSTCLADFLWPLCEAAMPIPKPYFLCRHETCSIAHPTLDCMFVATHQGAVRAMMPDIPDHMPAPVDGGQLR